MVKEDYEKMIEQALANGNIIIYGAHLVAKELYLYIKNLRRGTNFLGFAVTSMNGNPSELEKEKVAAIDTYEKEKNAYILIAMPEKFHKEVEEYLEVKGFLKYSSIGIRGISYLLGSDLVERKCVRGKYSLQESKNDYSWLDLCENKNVGDIKKVRHYKFPIITRFPANERFSCLERFRFQEDYANILGEYRNVHMLPISDTKSHVQDILDMYMVMSHKDSKSNKAYKIPDWTYSIQAGAALTGCRAGDFQDNKGENISEKNEAYAEMTAMYWIWKNSRPSHYKGICHYRRHFELDSMKFIAIVENHIDVILTTPRLVLNGIKEMFIQDTPVKEDVFENMMDSIKEIYGEKIYNKAQQYYNSILYYPNNMLIAKEKIFNAYCQWIFPVLFQMENHDCANGIMKKNRHIAFAAELLTSFYFVMNRDKYKIAVTDYIFLDGE